MATRPPANRAGIKSKVVWVAALGGSVTLLSPLLVNTLQSWESGRDRVLVAYADPLANGIPTVCNGLTRHVTTTPIVVGERWSAEKCVAEESAAIERVQRQLLPCFKRLPPPSVLDMASSHAWNLGAGATCGSGAMRAWNEGRWEMGCQRIARGDDGRLVWVFADGKFVKGLANRRADESQKCEAYL